jgi:hypothetical protein
VSPRIVFWLLLCLVAGGPCAFLVLEGAGIPYAAVAMLALISIGWRRHLLPETLLAFGLTYAIEIVHVASPAVFSALQQGDYLGAAYFALHIGVAVGIVAVGIVAAGALSSGLRRGMLEQDHKQGGG